MTICGGITGFGRVGRCVARNPMLAYQADVGVLFQVVAGIVDGVRRVPVA